MKTRTPSRTAKLILCLTTPIALFCLAASAATRPSPQEQGAARIARLLPPKSDYILDAGASQTLPLGTDGVARTNVEVTVAAQNPGTPASTTVEWFVSKPSDAAAVRFDKSDSLKTPVVFTKPGTYFLRADVKVGSWSDWASVVVHVFSAKETGLAMERFSQAPAPGIHPRIFFSPEDVPGIRARLKTTVIGQEITKKLQINSALLRKGSAGYNPKGPLGQLLDGSPSVGNVGYWASGLARYQALVAGDLTALGTEVPGMGGNIHRLSQGMAAEAFWCLINEDHEGVKKVAAAITTWAKIVTPTIKPEDDWQWNRQCRTPHLPQAANGAHLR